MRWVLCLAVVLTLLDAAGCGAASSTHPAGTRLTSDPTPTAARSEAADGLFGLTGAAGSVGSPTGAGYHVVSLGDSTGYGAFCHRCRPFGRLYADDIALDTHVATSFQNYSIGPGVPSSAQVQQVYRNSLVVAALRQATFVTVLTGYNDLVGPGRAVQSGRCGPPYACVNMAIAQAGRNVQAVLDRVRQLAAGRPQALRVLDYYNESAGRRDRWANAEAAFYPRLNAAICAAARATGAVCVDTARAFNGPTGARPAGGLLSDVDHNHPSAAGQQLIAALLRQAGYAPITR